MAISGCERQRSLDLNREAKMKMEREKNGPCNKVPEFSHRVSGGRKCVVPEGPGDMRRDQFPPENRPWDCRGRSFQGDDDLEGKSRPVSD